MEVIVYTKPGCVQCNATKKRIEAKGFTPSMIDVSADKAAFDHIIGLGYRQVPVVVAGDDHWAGFQPDKIDALPEPDAESSFRM
jgi:glutaredoxin-like protein NrdH